MNNRQKAHKRILLCRRPRCGQARAKRLSNNSSRAVFFYRIVRKFCNGLVISYTVYTARPKPTPKGAGVWVEDWHEVAKRLEKSKGDFERVLCLLGVEP